VLALAALAALLNRSQIGEKSRTGGIFTENKQTENPAGGLYFGESQIGGNITIATIS
jgi:hypothetical protein